MELDSIEVAMPTYNSAEVLKDTLRALETSSETSDVEISRLLIIDNVSTDGTEEIANTCAAEYGWDLELVSRPANLPEARKLAIEKVRADWFLFLDDDVRISATYLQQLQDSICPAVGAVQGRKSSRDEQNSEWVRRRARRGGTHATLCRREAVDDVSFPADLEVLEDEYLRRHVDDAGYLWIFNHQARFDHASQDRHPIGWQEGVLAGKYGLKPFHECALNVPFAAASGRNPIPHAMRTVGWLFGRLRSDEAIQYVETGSQGTETKAATPENTHDR